MMKRLNPAGIKAIVESHRFRVDTKSLPSDYWRLGINGHGVGQTEDLAWSTARCAMACGLIVRLIEIKHQKFGTIELAVATNCPLGEFTKPFSYLELR